MINYDEYEPEERWNKHAGKPKKNSDFHFKQNGIDLRYPDPVHSRDIILNGRLFRVWHPEARGDRELNASLANLSRYPDVFPYVAVMPDYHSGESSVNGSVIPSENLLYVNAIGGDIGCGMSFMRLPLKFEDLGGKLRDIYESIYRRVPTGRRVNITDYERFAAHPLFGKDLEVLNRGNSKDAQQQLGSLGSGNHFIEVQADNDGNLGVMVHTGSRAMGEYIRKIFMKKAKNSDKCKNLFYLEADSPEGQDYLKHVEFATEYAAENRREILRRTYIAFLENAAKLAEADAQKVLEGAIDIAHNFISREEHFGKQVYVHRKGAIRIPEDEFGVIPGSMGTPSYVVRGRGNPFSFNSCSHGAGRKMSRGQALRTVRREDFTKAMGEIISRNDDNILDEAPQAYKNIEDILKFQRDLIKINSKLKPLAVVKG